MRLEPGDYRRAALERLEDARRLRDERQWVGAAYMGGRGVECFLRALLCRQNLPNDSGHDLRHLMKNAGSLGLLRVRDLDELYEPVGEIAGIWHNNLRFVDERRFLRHLKQLKRDRGINGDIVEYWAKRLVEDCEAVINRAEVIWTRSAKS